MDDRELAARVLAMTPDELLGELGAELAGTSTAHLKDGEMDDLRLRARNWLARNWGALRELVCGNAAVTAVRGNELLELLAVADLILEAWLQKAGAFTAAAVICRFGLNRLCEGDELTGVG